MHTFCLPSVSDDDKSPGTYSSDILVMMSQGTAQNEIDLVYICRSEKKPIRNRLAPLGGRETLVVAIVMCDASS